MSNRFDYLRVHDGATNERDAEENGTGHFEDFESSMLVNGAAQAERNDDTKHRHRQQHRPIHNVNESIQLTGFPQSTARNEMELNCFNIKSVNRLQQRLFKLVHYNELLTKLETSKLSR